MASVNKVTILGNLGRDPETRYLPSGDAITNIAVATSYRTKDKNTGEQKDLVEWHRISFFGRLAEIAGQYLEKGSSVYVEGRLQTRKYTDKDGIERYATEIVAENMQLLGGRERGGQTQGGEQRAPAQQQRQPDREQARDRQHAVANRQAPPRDFSDMDSDIPF